MGKISDVKIRKLKEYGTYEEYELKKIASSMILDLRKWVDIERNRK